MKMVKFEGKSVAVLHADMVRGVREGCTRLQAALAMGNVVALFAEARALAARACALVELLEGDLSEKGRYAGRKEQG